MPWADHIAGLGVGLRREVRNLFGFDERNAKTSVIGLAVLISPVPKQVTTARGIPMPLSIDYNYRAALTEPVDQNGNPTSYDGPVGWESLTPEVADVRADSPDGLTGFVETVALGTLRYRLSADLDRGDGVKPFSVEFEIDVQAGDAIGIETPGFERVAKE